MIVRLAGAGSVGITRGEEGDRRSSRSLSEGIVVSERLSGETGGEGHVGDCYFGVD